MKPSLRIVFSLLLCCGCVGAFSQTPDSVRVLIIYGSEPAKGHPHQYKWFGGRPGGHVGLQVGKDRVLSFAPTKYHPICHIFPSRKSSNFRSAFRTESVTAMWETFNYTGAHYSVDSLKRLVVAIPITPLQRKKLDSLTKVYLKHPPYDYAVVGMRCASATYEILEQMGLFEDGYKNHIWWHLLFPRDIRYELLKEAKHGKAGKTWRVYATNGCRSRRWDYDRKVE